MKKPDGAGYIESSVEDRYASHHSIPSDMNNGGHPGMKPIGSKGDVTSGSRPATSWSSDVSSSKVQ